MIKLENISKTFAVKDRTVEAVKNVSIEINDGEIYGIIGFSGAGKSTLLRMMCGVYKTEIGSVKIDGEDVFDNPKATGSTSFGGDFCPRLPATN